MYYPDEIIEEVRVRNPIVDVIGSYVHLQKKGGNYFGLCPFHNEKSPSFSVSPGKQMFHCFGCGAGGNVITFVMDYENASFQEAVEILAKRAGIELPKPVYSPHAKEEADARAVMLEIHKEAAIYYVRLLKSPQGKQGMDYFKKRGLSDETIRAFGLGYTGSYPYALYQYLKKKGYTDKQLSDAGLVTIREKGGADKFWNRVMFPIMDANNRVIAFGGRVLGDGEPKYLNSPETKIFDKSRNLYGLNVARRTKEKNFLVCEGYMDVISMHQAGFTNAVASLGTAFTVQHGMVMKRYTDEVVLCYDNDGAGRKAALRAIPILKEAGLRIKVLDLAPYKDPDEFMKNLGAEEFRKRVNGAQNAFLYEVSCLKDGYDFSDPEDKANFFNETAKKIAGFEDEIERNTYTEAVAKKYGIDYGILKSKVSRIGQQQGITKKADDTWKPKATVTKLPSKENGIREAQKMILTDLAERPAIFPKLSKLLSPADFSDELMSRVAEEMYAQLSTGKTLNVSTIIDHYIQDERYQEVSAILSSTFMEGAEDAERRQALKEAVIRVKEAALEKKINAAADAGEFMKLLQEKQDLRNQNIDI